MQSVGQNRVLAFCRIPPSALQKCDSVKVINGNRGIEVRRSLAEERKKTSGKRGNFSSSENNNSNSTALADSNVSSQLFTLDDVLNGSSQEEVYERTTAPLVFSFLQGTSATVISCGHAKSGRSYTLFGSKDYATRGLVARSLHTVFSGILASSGVRRFLIKVSFILLQGEEIVDLLDRGPSSSQAAGGGDVSGHSSKPSVVLDGKGVPVWRNIIQKPCDSESQVLEALLAGVQASSDNLGHRIFTISLERRGVDEEDAETRWAHLHFVDLVGPCKIGRASQVERLRVHSINRSLSSLEQVVLCLSRDASEENQRHIPYRESRLTTILKGSVGLRCLTSVIAHINPKNGDSEAFLSTLQFVARIRRVPVTPYVNIVYSTETQIKQLQRQVTELQTELRLQQQIKNESVSPMLSPDERRILLERLNAYLSGSAPNVRLSNVREVHESLSFMKDEIEKRDKTIRELQEQLQLVRGANPTGASLNSPPRGDGKRKERRSISRGGGASSSNSNNLLGSGFAPTRLDESAGLSFGVSSKQSKHISRSNPIASDGSGIDRMDTHLQAPSSRNSLAHAPREGEYIVPQRGTEGADLTANMEVRDSVVSAGGGTKVANGRKHGGAATVTFPSPRSSMQVAIGTSFPTPPLTNRGNTRLRPHSATVTRTPLQTGEGIHALTYLRAQKATAPLIDPVHTVELDTTDDEDTAFQKYKQSPAGNSQIRAICRDQQKLKELEQEIIAARDELSELEFALKTVSTDKNLAGRRPASSEKVHTLVSPIDGAEWSSIQETTEGAESREEAPDMVRLAANHKRIHEKITQLTFNSQSLSRQLERRNAAFLSNFEHWLASMQNQQGQSWAGTAAPSILRPSTASASPAPKLVDGAERLQEAEYARLQAIDPASAAYYRASLRAGTKSRSRSAGEKRTTFH